MDKSYINRRTFLTNAAGIVLAGSCLKVSPVLAAKLAATPPQVLGPFYPLAFPPDADFDLTLLADKTDPAAGEVIEITGQVVDTNEEPVKNAKVEIWQANVHGRYNHPRDPNTQPLDHNFQGYGTVNSDESGLFRFLTIKPGTYPASKNWIRPPHVHFKVTAAGRDELVTQMYFKDDLLNDTDYILNDAPNPEALVVDFQPLPAYTETSILTGHFKIILS